MANSPNSACRSGACVAWYSHVAMSATRLTLLCAFAGGCLSNALLFGLWRVAEGAGESAAKKQQRPADVVQLVTAAIVPPNVAQPSELVAASAADHGADAAIAAAPAPAASDPANGGPALAGSAVSEVLTRLEAAYRERVVARAPASAPAPPAQERGTAAVPADSAVAATEAAPSAPTQPAVEVIRPAISTAYAGAATAAAAIAPQVAAVPAVAFQDAPPPAEIHYGDVNQNTYITNIREGDVYQIQMQQVAILQYMQLLGLSGGLAAPARQLGGAGHQRGALSSGITNPDNPWGFHFARPNLVH
jgi:hypothetical protein